MTWQPIETAPKQKAPMIVVRGILASGYVTDPWCVWWQDGEWVRWPHKESPTHWLELPELDATPEILKGNADLVPGNVCTCGSRGACARCHGMGRVQG